MSDTDEPRAISAESAVQFKTELQRLQGVSRYRELEDGDTPDVYILTDHAKELLTRELPFVSYKIPDFETLFGVPFESYPTIQQALQRVAELNQAGKSVALIAD